jgi:hypothetical protein
MYNGRELSGEEVSYPCQAHVTKLTYLTAKLPLSEPHYHLTTLNFGKANSCPMVLKI